MSLTCHHHLFNSIDGRELHIPDLVAESWQLELTERETKLRKLEIWVSNMRFVDAQEPCEVCEAKYRTADTEDGWPVVIRQHDYPTECLAAMKRQGLVYTPQDQS